MESEPAEGPFELGKPVSSASDSDERPEDKFDFGDTTVTEGTVEGLSIPAVTKQSEPDTKDDEKTKDEGQFEWGKPLLGGSSDEEDYGEDGTVFDQVSIPLQRSVKKPDQEVIEEYVDDQGRRVKRISKVTTTRTITRVERQTPEHELAVDVPAEPREDVEEYIDEHGRRVRRVVRTSITTSTRTVLRDGAVKVVLTPGVPGEQELSEGPEDAERIQTFTSDHGHRTQKLMKSVFKTQLKRPTGAATVTLPHEITSPHDDEPPENHSPDENVRFESVERSVSYPEWLEAVKEKPPTPREVSYSPIQIEPHPSELPTVHDTERPPIVEEVSASAILKHPPVISLQALDDDEEIAAVRERKRIEPPVGLPESPEIPRKKVHKESEPDVPSSTPPTEREGEDGMEVEVEEEGDEPLEEDEDSEEDYDEFDEEIVILEIKRRPRIPKWFVVLPDEPEKPLKPESLAYSVKTTQLDPQIKERPEIRESVSCINIDRKITIPELSSSDIFPAKEDTQTPEEVEEYVDENGVRVRRISKRTLTTTTTVIRTAVDDRDEPQTKVFESAAPVYLEEDSDNVVPSVQTREFVLPEWMIESEPTPTEDKRPQGDVAWLILPSQPKVPESKEDLDLDDVRESVTATTLNREVVIPEIEGMDDETPEEVEEYVDENGVRVRRIVKRTITTRTIIRTAVDDRDEPQTVPSVQTREVVLPEWMVESEPPPQEAKFPQGEVSWLILPSQPKEPKSKEDLEREDVTERVTATTLNRGIVVPEFEGMENESPEEVEEFVDENGVRVRRIVKRTITTRTIKREDQQIEPVEVTFPDAQAQDESPEEVEEYIDENGVRVKRIVKRTITTKTIIRTTVGDRDEAETKVFESAAPVYLDSEDVVPSVQTRKVVIPEWMVESEPPPQEAKVPHRDVSWIILPSQPKEPKSKEDLEREDVTERVTATTLDREIVIPEIEGLEDDSPEQVEEFVDENGVRVRRIVKPTITTRTIIRSSADDRDEPQTKVFESAAPVYLDSEDVVPSVKTREVVLPEWMVESEPAPQDSKQSHGKVSWLILPSEPKEPESKEYLEHEDLTERVTATTLNREIVIPEIEGMEDESPEEVEEFVDENGVQVRTIVRRTITTRTIKREDQQIEPVEVTFPVAQTQDESPEEVEEYVDENGARVRRTVKRTVTTRTIIRTTGDDRDEPETKVFGTAAPAYLDSENVVPSVQTREVVLPEWMVESEPPPQEAKVPQGEVSWIILPSQPKEPKSKEDLEREDVTERVTATTSNREIVIPEIEGMEDESPEEVEEYIEENGVRVRRIVKRTITTRTIIRTTDDDRDEPETKVFETAAPVYMDSEDVIPSVQSREVALPEWMVESEPPPQEAKVPQGDVSWIILPSQPKEPKSKKDLEREDVTERVTATTLDREIVIPEIEGMEDDSPEEFQEFVDENGVRVRRVVKRTITTRTIIRSSADDRGEPQTEVFESTAPVYLDSEDVVPSVKTREVVLPEWMAESVPSAQELKQPQGEVSWLILPSRPKESESKEDLERESVTERVTATTLNREIVIPEIEGMEDESPEEVEEFVDENGVRVRRIVKRTITTRSIVRRQGPGMEPVTTEFPVVDVGGNSPEEVEEFVDENGVRVRRIVKRSITTTTVQRRGVLETSVLESGVPVVMHKVMEEGPSGAEMETLEPITPEAILLAHTPPSSPRRASMPYETTVVQRYLIIIETLYQYVLEHKSMIFIYSSKHVQFNFVLENFLYWMLGTLKTLSWMRPVSWKVDEIQSQLREIKVLLSHGMCLHLHDGCQRC